MSYAPGPGGSRTSLNITAPTQIKAAQGYVYRVFVLAAPSAAGGIYDTVNATTPAAAANQIENIPTSSTSPIVLVCPFENGLYVDPGTGGVVAVSYD